MKLDSISMLLGLAGLGAVAYGGLMIYNQTQVQKATGVSGALAKSRGSKKKRGMGDWFFGRNDPADNLVTKRYAQAPVVSEFKSSKSGMKTKIRESKDMPIEQRLATIQDMIYQSVQDPDMRELALNITAHCPERDKKCEAKAVYDYTKKNVRYTGDIGPIQFPDGSVDGIDLYQSAKRTKRLKGGDCDDHSILNGTLLSLNGIEARLRVTASSKNVDFEHIYAFALMPDGKAYALDTTLPGNDNFGYEVPFVKNLDFPA